WTASTSGSARSASYEPYARPISHSLAYSSARAWSRLATATSSTAGDACAPGITFRLMSAVEMIPHLTASATLTPLRAWSDRTSVVSPRDRDRCWHAGLRVHGQGAFERVQED